MSFYSRETIRLVSLIGVLIAFLAGYMIIDTDYVSPMERKNRTLTVKNMEMDKKLREDIVLVESYADRAKQMNDNIFNEGVKSGTKLSAMSGQELFLLPRWRFMRNNDVPVSDTKEMERIISSFGVRTIESEMYWRNQNVRQTSDLVSKNHPKIKKKTSQQFFVDQSQATENTEYGFLFIPMLVNPTDGVPTSINTIGKDNNPR